MAQNSYRQSYSQAQRQSQKQVQRLSMRQIQALSFLEMNARDLREAIYKAAAENPALELVKDPLNESLGAGRQNGQRPLSGREAEYSVTPRGGSEASDSLQRALEAKEAYGETLQQHLLHQLNMMRLLPDEYDLCQRLVYNLDKNGFYGSMLAPESLLDKKRPLQTKRMLEECISRIQQLDPVGTCCKNPEESLFVQAKIAGDAPELVLFILDGHLELLNPPEPDKVSKKLIEFREQWKKKKFAGWIPLNDIDITPQSAGEAIRYILDLNPRPAGEYVSDVSQAQFERPDIVLSVTREAGRIAEDDFSLGKICADGDFHFQVKYASGSLPELRLSADMSFDKQSVAEAKAFLGSLEYRQSTIVLQGCAIVSAQKDFFEHGQGHLLPLTRRQLAQRLGINESTVSRMTGKNGSKYIQTEWGLFPASYFFPSGVSAGDGKNKVSSEAIKARLGELLAENPSLSDSQLAELLGQQGISIARRTVAKYRTALGIKNSYSRK